MTKLLSKDRIAGIRMNHGKVLMSPEDTQAAFNTMEAYWRLRELLVEAVDIIELTRPAVYNPKDETCVRVFKFIKDAIAEQADG